MRDRIIDLGFRVLTREQSGAALGHRQLAAGEKMEGVKVSGLRLRYWQETNTPVDPNERCLLETAQTLEEMSPIVVGNEVAVQMPDPRPT